MPVTCDYSFNFNRWEDETGRNHPSNNDIWECPREVQDDEQHCILHLSSDKKNELSITEKDIIRQILDDFESKNPDRKKFIGMELKSFKIQNNIADISDNFEIVITNCTISGELNMSQSEFSPPVYVEFCEIDSIKANSAKFERYTSFRNLTIKEDACFRRSRFQDRVLFDSTEIGGDFDFSNVVARSVSFKPYEVSGTEPPVDTYNVESAESPRNQFKGSFKFRETEISSVHMYYAKFHSEVDFGIATYDNLYIVDCLFFDGFDMKSAIVNRSLITGQSGGSVQCSHTTFDSLLFTMWPESDELIVDFQRCEIQAGSIRSTDSKTQFCFPAAKLGEVELSLSQSLIYETKYDGFDFSRYRESLEKHGWTLHEFTDNTADFLDQIDYDNKFSYSGLITTYLRAKDGSRHIGDDTISSKFFIKEMVFRRKRHAKTMRSSEYDVSRRASSLIAFFNSWMYNIFSRYGEGLGITILWSLGIILMSALLYPAVGGIGTSPTSTSLTYSSAIGTNATNSISQVIINSIYFSLVTFTTLGYGDYQPITLVAKLIVGVESLSGTLLIALIIFTLSRRIIR